MDYEDQLERAMEATPESESAGERFTVPDVEVRQEGKMTVFENFDRTTDVLNRRPGHVTKFFQNELGTSGHIDERGRARFKGEFRPDRIQQALDDYVDSFVRCGECASPDTRLVTEQGATVLKCDACGALSATPEP